jgi:hypothetical protein
MILLRPTVNLAACSEGDASPAVESVLNSHDKHQAQALLPQMGRPNGRSNLNTRPFLVTPFELICQTE